MAGRVGSGLGEGWDISGKNSSAGTRGKWSIPGKGADKTNVLGRNDCNLFSELIADDSSRVSERRMWCQTALETGARPTGVLCLRGGCNLFQIYE